MAYRLARCVGQEVLLGDICDVFALRILREQVIERLILVRPNLRRDRLVPLLGIVELRIDVEHDTAKRKQAVTNHLADLELRVAHFAHAQTDIVQDCGIRQIVKGCNGPPPPDPWPQPGGRDRQRLWPASRWHRPASCRISSTPLSGASPTRSWPCRKPPLPGRARTR